MTRWLVVQVGPVGLIILALAVCAVVLLVMDWAIARKLADLDFHRRIRHHDDLVTAEERQQHWSERNRRVWGL